MLNVLSNLFVAAVLAGTPLLLGALGEILTEKAGNMNLGVEGMMFMGAITGLVSSYYYEQLVLNAGGTPSGFVSAFVALIASFIAGAFGALIYSFLTITLRANQNVTGLTLTIFGTGFANFFGEFFAQKAGGYIAVTDVTKKAFVGLNLRAVGESPATADAAGIPIETYKYAATIIGGGICGIGGMYMSMVTTSGVWVHGCVGGYGWLAVALVIFATWSPARAVLVSVVFGGLTVMRMYISIPGLPTQIYDMIPYIATILVLVFTSMHENKEHAQPKSCGINYFREER